MAVLLFRKAGVCVSVKVEQVQCACGKCIPSAVMKRYPWDWRQYTGVRSQDKIMCDISVILKAFR